MRFLPEEELEPATQTVVSHASPWNFIQGSGNISILKSVPRQDSGASNDIHDLAVAMDYIIVEREKKGVIFAVLCSSLLQFYYSYSYYVYESRRDCAPRSKGPWL